LSASHAKKPQVVRRHIGGGYADGERLALLRMSADF
jgi:hypothetical protein